VSALRCPDELAREVLRSTLAFVADAYAQPRARASTIAAAAEGRFAAAMAVAECPDLMRELFSLRMAAACASGSSVSEEMLAEWREGYAWATKAPGVVRAVGASQVAA